MSRRLFPVYLLILLLQPFGGIFGSLEVAPPPDDETFFPACAGIIYRIGASEKTIGSVYTQYADEFL